MKFFDACAGIGAGRVAFEHLGFECVGFSEVDSQAEKTYRLFFGNQESNFGDITQIDKTLLPNFDIMIAGFPCQTFSIAGKRNGINDKRGHIIFHLIDILKLKKTPFFLFENVKGLINHDRGKTFRYILKLLDESGYNVQWKVVNSLNYGTPQMRERVYLLGTRKNITESELYFNFLQNTLKVSSVKDYLIDEKNTFLKNTPAYQTFLNYLNNKYNKNKYSLLDILKKDFLVLDTRQSDLRLYNNKVPTLRFGRQGILYVKGGELKKLSGYEALLLQGFPKDLAQKAKKNITESHILKQAGNAMTINVIETIAQNFLLLKKNLEVA